MRRSGTDRSAAGARSCPTRLLRRFVGEDDGAIGIKHHMQPPSGRGNRGDPVVPRFDGQQSPIAVSYLDVDEVALEGDVQHLDWDAIRAFRSLLDEAAVFGASIELAR